MFDNSCSEWRTGDFGSRTFCAFRWLDNHVVYVRNASGMILRFRTRAAAQRAADKLNLAL